MFWFAMRRLLWAIPILLVASVLVFVAMQATTDPGALVGPGIRAEDIQRFREDLGLDQPAHEQYLIWLGNFVQGDLGESLKTRQEVWPDLWQAMRNTIQLGMLGFMITIVVGVSIGTIAALKHNSLIDHLATGTSFVAVSVPPFLSGLVLLVVVGIYFKDSLGDFLILTNGTRFDMWSADRMKAIVLPAITLAIQQLAVYSRYMRSSMLDVLNADYLRTARAKGVSEPRVIVRHGMRNALIPLVTYSAVDIGALIGGLIITERVFEWHGMGWYFLNAFAEGDYFRVLPWAMIVVASVIMFNLIADLLYGVLDPRIRHG
jgi:peptide/nickel transport system permease protein